MKNLFTLFICLAFSGMTFATQYTLSGAIDGLQANAGAGTGSSATGMITGTYDDVTNVLNYTFTWEVLSGPASVAHIHGPAAAGVNAGVQVPISTTSPATDNTVITDAQETDLLAGLWYVNIHTVANPGGEIRGQITATAVAIPTMSQWALFILALGLSVLALVYVKRRQTIKI